MLDGNAKTDYSVNIVCLPFEKGSTLNGNIFPLESVVWRSLLCLVVCFEAEKQEMRRVRTHTRLRIIVSSALFVERVWTTAMFTAKILC